MGRGAGGASVHNHRRPSGQGTGAWPAPGLLGWGIATWLEATASRLEAIAIRLEAIAIRLEAVAIRFGAIAIRFGGNRY